MKKITLIALKNRIIVLALSVGTLIFITLFITAHDKGYYFMFTSIVGMSVFLELGLNYTISQYCSHLVRNKNNIEGINNNNELKIIIKYGITESFKTTLKILVLFIGLGGTLIYYKKNVSYYGFFDGIMYAWLLISIFASIDCFLSSFVMILEGCGEQIEMEKLKIITNLIKSVTLWIGILFEFGLFSIGLSYIASTFIVAYWILKKYKYFFNECLSYKNTVELIKIKKEIKTFEKRIALSWFSGAFVSYSFVPILMLNMRPEEVGKIGIMLHVLNSVNYLAITIITVANFNLCNLVALNQHSNMNKLFKKIFIISCAFEFVAISTIIILINIIDGYSKSIADRFLSVENIILLSIIFFQNHIVSCLSVYLRIYKIEAFYILSIIVGISVPISNYYGSYNHDLSSVIYYYFIINTTIYFMGSFIIFRHHRDSLDKII